MKLKREYCGSMPEAGKFSFEQPATILDGEDEETLADIDEGIHDAEAGRTVPAEEVRKLMAQWITDSSTRKER
jgi:predicted transcriptional regulator